MRRLSPIVAYVYTSDAQPSGVLERRSVLSAKGAPLSQPGATPQEYGEAIPQGLRARPIRDYTGQSNEAGLWTLGHIRMRALAAYRHSTVKGLASSSSPGLAVMGRISRLPPRTRVVESTLCSTRPADHLFPSPDNTARTVNNNILISLRRHICRQYLAS